MIESGWCRQECCNRKRIEIFRAGALRRERKKNRIVQDEIARAESVSSKRNLGLIIETPTGHSASVWTNPFWDYWRTVLEDWRQGLRCA